MPVEDTGDTLVEVTWPSDKQLIFYKFKPNLRPY